jgi:hypothetical protein
MLSSAARRVTAITVLAAVLVAALVAISSATAAAQRSHVVCRDVCPANPSQVAAAYTYLPSR